MAYYGGRGDGLFDGGRGGGGGRFPLGRGGGAAVGGGGAMVPLGRGGGGDGVGRAAVGGGQDQGAGKKTLAAAMAKRTPIATSIDPEAVRAAEAAAAEVVLRVHPTKEAEQRRQDVIGYAQRLIGSSLGCEVFAFGSVPLKTYLPDGDVDITVLGNTSLDGNFIDDVRIVLESEEQNADAELELKSLQFINAEVKLIKCVIENIVVDISFNQIGGVSTLCFLELVDSEVGKNHLFKRSIILIKAWCYHESRILGAHHGLISTYALETLILYIFNIFHKSLRGPFEALYKFLEYFSKFDWEKYCICLNGPVALSSFPNITVEPAAIDGELLLGEEFLNGTLHRLLVLSQGSDACNAKFRLKHLNIIDPLKENNNLGRSVSKGSFYRIRSAFSFGAQKLGQILMLPCELITGEIYAFFANTLRRHERGERPDLGDSGLFNSLFGCENALREDVSGLNFSCINGDENRNPGSSLELPDKESHVKTNMHRTSDRHFFSDAQDRPWNKIWFTKSAADHHKMVSGASMSARSSYPASIRSHSSFSVGNGNRYIEQFHNNCATEEDLPLTRASMQQQICANNPSHVLTSSTRTNTLDDSNSRSITESNWTDAHKEKLLLPPFSPLNLLDLSGDLDLHSGCLRKVQYHFESLFDEFMQSVQEASLAGVLDEDLFKILTLKFLSNTDARPTQVLLASSINTEKRNFSPVSPNNSIGDESQQSHTEVQVEAVCQQNVSLTSGSNGLSSPPPPADSELYHVSWFYTTEDIPKTHPNMNVSLPSGTEIISNELTSSPSPTADSENYPVPWTYIPEDIPKTRGTGTYIPQMSYNTYKERIWSEKGRKQKQKQPDRQLKIQVSPSGSLHQDNSIELGYSGPSNDRITVESVTNQVLIKQNSSQQDSYSRKSLVPEAGFVSSKERPSTDCGTKQISTSQQWKVRNSQPGDACSNMNMIDNQKSDTNEGLVRPENASKDTLIFHLPKVQKIQTRPSSPRLALPRYAGNGQGNLPVCNTYRPSSPATTGQIKAQQKEIIEFGSLGPLSLELLSAEFDKAFPPLPTIKRPVEVPVSTVQSPTRGATQSRPEGLYELKDDADFPPLQARRR